MRTIPQREEAKDQRRVGGDLMPAYVNAVTWEPPPQQYGQRDGRPTRSYQCLACKEVGLVILPKHHKGESDEELMAVYLGPGTAFYCPSCRATASVYRIGVRRSEVEADQAEHPRWAQARLAHWLELRRAQIKEEQDQDAPTEKEVRAAMSAGVAAANKSVPRQSAFDQAEEADQARRRKEG